ncbi:hypothetical protein PCE1_002450 [Barthelona sp. PCE]
MDNFLTLISADLRYNELFSQLFSSAIDLDAITFSDIPSLKAQRIYLDLSIAKKRYDEVYQIGMSASTKTSWVRKYIANLFKTQPKFFHHMITKENLLEVFSTAPVAFRARYLSQLSRYGKNGRYTAIADAIISDPAWNQLLSGKQLRTLYIAASPTVAKKYILDKFNVSKSIPFEFIQPRFYEIVYDIYTDAMHKNNDSQLYGSTHNHYRFNNYVLNSPEKSREIFLDRIKSGQNIHSVAYLCNSSKMHKSQLLNRIMHKFAVEEPKFFIDELFKAQVYTYSTYWEMMPYFIKYHGDDIAVKAFKSAQYRSFRSISSFRSQYRERGIAFSTEPGSLFMRLLECYFDESNLYKYTAVKDTYNKETGNVISDWYTISEYFASTKNPHSYFPGLDKFRHALANHLYVQLEKEEYWDRYYKPEHLSNQVGTILNFVTLECATTPKPEYTVRLSGKTYEVSHILYLFIGKNGLLHTDAHATLYRLLQRFICTGDWTEWDTFKAVTPHIIGRVPEDSYCYINIDYDHSPFFYKPETVDNLAEYFIANIDHEIMHYIYKSMNLYQFMVNHKIAPNFFPLEHMKHFFDKMMEIADIYDEKVEKRNECADTFIRYALINHHSFYTQLPYVILPHRFERGKCYTIYNLDDKRNNSTHERHDKYNKIVNYVSEECYRYVIDGLLARQATASTDMSILQHIFNSLIHTLISRRVWNYAEKQLCFDNQELVRQYSLDQYISLCNGSTFTALRMLCVDATDMPGPDKVYPIARPKARHKVVKGYQDPLTNSRIITRSDFVSKMYRISSVYDIPNVERFDSLAIQVRDEIAYYFDPLDKLFGLYADLEELDRDISEMSDRDIEDEEAEAEYKEMLQSRRDLVESISDLINSTLDLNEINNMLRTLQFSLRFSTTFLNEEFVKRIIGFTHLSNRAFTNSNILELFKRVIFILGRIMCLTDLSFAEMARSALLTALTIPKSAPFVRTLLEGYVMHTSVEEQKRLFDDLIALAYSDEWRFGITPMKMIIGVVQALSRQNAGVNPAAFLKVMWDQETMAVDVRLVLLNFAVDQISLMLNKGWSDSVFESEYWQLVGLAARRFYGVVVIVERIVEFITFLYNKIGTEHWNDAFNCVVGHWLCPIMEKEFRDTRTDYKNVEIVLNSIINASLHNQGYSLVNVSLPDRFLQFCEQYAQPIFRYFSRFTEMICLVFSQRRDSKRLLKMLEPLKDTFRENLTVSIEQHLAKARDRTHQLYVPFLNNNLVAQKLTDVCKYYLKDDIALTREFFRTISTFMLECYNEIDGFHIGEVWWKTFIAGYHELIPAIKAVLKLYSGELKLPHISYNGNHFSLLGALMYVEVRSETVDNMCKAMKLIEDSDLKSCLKLRWMTIMLKVFTDGGIGYSGTYLYPSSYIDRIPLETFLRARVSDTSYFNVLTRFLDMIRAGTYYTSMSRDSVSAFRIGTKRIASKKDIEPYIRPIIRPDHEENTTE